MPSPPPGPPRRPHNSEAESYCQAQHRFSETLNLLLRSNVCSDEPESNRLQSIFTVPVNNGLSGGSLPSARARHPFLPGDHIRGVTDHSLLLAAFSSGFLASFQSASVQLPLSGTPGAVHCRPPSPRGCLRSTSAFTKTKQSPRGPTEPSPRLGRWPLLNEFAQAECLGTYPSSSLFLLPHIQPIGKFCQPTRGPPISSTSSAAAGLPYRSPFSRSCPPAIHSLSAGKVV